MDRSELMKKVSDLKEKLFKDSVDLKSERFFEQVDLSRFQKPIITAITKKKETLNIVNLNTVPAAPQVTNLVDVAVPPPNLMDEAIPELNLAPGVLDESNEDGEPDDESSEPNDELKEWIRKQKAPSGYSSFISKRGTTWFIKKRTYSFYKWIPYKNNNWRIFSNVLEFILFIEKTSRIYSRSN